MTSWKHTWDLFCQRQLPAVWRHVKQQQVLNLGRALTGQDGCLDGSDVIHNLIRVGTCKASGCYGFPGSTAAPHARCGCQCHCHALLDWYSSMQKTLCLNSSMQKSLCLIELVLNSSKQNWMSLRTIHALHPRSTLQVPWNKPPLSWRVFVRSDVGTSWGTSVQSRNQENCNGAEHCCEFDTPRTEDTKKNKETHTPYKIVKHWCFMAQKIVSLRNGKKQNRQHQSLELQREKQKCPHI